MSATASPEDVGRGSRGRNRARARPPRARAIVPGVRTISVLPSWPESGSRDPRIGPPSPDRPRARTPPAIAALTPAGSLTSAAGSPPHDLHRARRQDSAAGHPTTGPRSWPLWTAPAAILVGLVVGVLGASSSSVAEVGGSSSAAPDAGGYPRSATSCSTSASSSPRCTSRSAPGGGRGRRTSGTAGSPCGSGSARSCAAGAGYLLVTAVYQSIVKLHGTDKLPSGPRDQHEHRRARRGGDLRVRDRADLRGVLLPRIRLRRPAPVADQGRRARIGTWVAAVETGILFGLAHTGSASAQYLIPLGFLGFVLCIVRWRTRSLYPCMALHSVNNSIALGYNELQLDPGEILAPGGGLDRGDRGRDPDRFRAARRSDPAPSGLLPPHGSAAHTGRGGPAHRST